MLEVLNNKSESGISRKRNRKELTNYKQRLCNAIGAVEGSGSFAISKPLASFPPPGLTVAGVGDISVPVSSRDILGLIEHSRQAPFGFKDQTLVDTAVRKTWEIDGSEIECRNPAWNTWLRSIIGEIATGLGTPAAADDVKAELYKMLVYEKGSMFKVHKDIERSPGMFGTLVLSLLSEHEGGAVRLRHKDKEVLLRTDENSAWQMSYLAWYADVDHEIEPVLHGHRIVLTYNLVCTKRSRGMNAERSTDLCNKISELQKEWLGFAPSPPFLCWAFDHRYAEANLRLSRLKGIDYHRACHVLQASELTGDFYVLFANLNKHEVSSEDSDDSSEEWTKLENIVDIHGNVLRESRHVRGSNIIQLLYENWRAPDSQSGGGYMENQHQSVTYTYNDTVMILIPKANITDFLVCMSSELTDEEFKKDIRAATVGPAFVALCLLGDHAKAAEVLACVTESFDFHTFANLGQICASDKHAVPEHLLLDAFKGIPTLDRFYSSLKGFFECARVHNIMVEAGGIGSREWGLTLIIPYLSEMKVFGREDAKPFCEIAKAYDQEAFDSIIQPAGVPYGSQDFNNALIFSLLKDGPINDKPHKSASTLLTMLLPVAVPQFDLFHYSSIKKAQAGGTCYAKHVDVTESNVREASVLRHLYGSLLSRNKDDATHLLVKITKQSRNIRAEQLPRFVVPSLQQMAYIFEHDAVNGTTFYGSLLSSLLELSVGREPEPPADWSLRDQALRLPQSGSGKNVCPGLSQFLLDPQAQIWEHTATNCACRSYLPGDCVETAYRSYPTFEARKTVWQKYRERHDRWEKHADSVLAALKCLPTKQLDEHLGQKFHDMMTLKHLRTDTDSVRNAEDITV